MQNKPAPADRNYVGTRTGQGGPGLVVYAGEGPSDVHRLDPRLDLRNHSPDGFQWSYGGSGPAQLALALVADATGDDELAQRVYQQFKFQIIGNLKDDSWNMTAGEIAKFARLLDAGKEPA